MPLFFIICTQTFQQCPVTLTQQLPIHEKALSPLTTQQENQTIKPNKIKSIHLMKPYQLYYFHNKTMKEDSIRNYE